MPLSDVKVRTAKPRAKPYKIFDEKGLYLLVTPTGSKWWRLRYRFDGKEKLLSVGTYPGTTLAMARAEREKALALKERGIDPSANKKALKAATTGSAANSFEVIARQWWAKTAPTLVESTRQKHYRWFDADIFPAIGVRPIADITAPELMTILKRIESRGATDVARRVHNLCGRVFRYAVGHGLAARDPSRDIELRDVLPPENVRHHASVKTPTDAGDLMRAIDGYRGSFASRCALRLAPYVFVRPGELRQAEWSEIDFDQREWRIPGAKMKMREQHIVPLAKQSIAILREIQALTGSGRFVFPSERTSQRAMSENTVNAALRRLGYGNDEMTGHGFRSLASTLLHELGCPHDVIERQLAHGERNKVSAAYNHAQHLPERKKMMQKWADYLEGLRDGKKTAK